MSHPAAEAVPTGNTYDKYASSNPVERRLMAGFFSALDRALPDTHPRRILEVGVGEGEVTARIAQRWPTATLVGLDLPDDELASHWEGRSFAPLFGDIGRLPFRDREFDLVLAIEVLEHVPFPELALAELARVTTGDVVVSVPREPIWRAANLARGKYLTDLGNFAKVNEIMARYFAEPYPARAAVGVKELPKGALVEADAILVCG